jgi:hypothetical protein
MFGTCFHDSDSLSASSELVILSIRADRVAFRRDSRTQSLSSHLLLKRSIVRDVGGATFRDEDSKHFTTHAGGIGGTADGTFSVYRINAHTQLLQLWHEYRHGLPVQRVFVVRNVCGEPR